LVPVGSICLRTVSDDAGAHGPVEALFEIVDTMELRRRLEEAGFQGEWHETGFMFTRKDGRAHDVDVVSQRFTALIGKSDLPGSGITT
jgi:hypothetical protein